MEIEAKLSIVLLVLIVVLIEFYKTDINISYREMMISAISLARFYFSQMGSSHQELPISTNRGEFLIEKNLLPLKPPMIGDIFDNQDFLYDSRGFLSEQPNLESPYPILNQTDWNSDGWYENQSVKNRKGIIVIHPIDNEMGRHVQNDAALSEGPYVLRIGVSHIGGFTSYSKATGCDDAILYVKIKEEGNSDWYIIDEFFVDNYQPWMDIEYDLGHMFDYRYITVRIESGSGGPCGEWSGEWAAIDYMDMIKGDK